MSEPAVVRFPNPDELARAVAERFLDLVADLQAAGRVPQVALTGGSVADAVHRQIAALALASGVDWLAVDFWWGDERYVPADSPDRNAGQARGAFLDAVGATRIHEMPTPSSACSVDEGARAYSAQIRAVPSGRFDLVMLGMGQDGHVASLFPGYPQVEVSDQIAVGVTGSPKPPSERITLTLPALNRSARLWVIATDTGPGGAKEAALKGALAGDESLPAGRVRGEEETNFFVS